MQTINPTDSLPLSLPKINGNFAEVLGGVIQVANAAERKDPVTYINLNVQTTPGHLWVIQADILNVIWQLIAIDVTLDASWVPLSVATTNGSIRGQRVEALAPGTAADPAFFWNINSGLYFSGGVNIDHSGTRVATFNDNLGLTVQSGTLGTPNGTSANPAIHGTTATMGLWFDNVNGAPCLKGSAGPILLDAPNGASSQILQASTNGTAANPSLRLLSNNGFFYNLGVSVAHSGSEVANWNSTTGLTLKLGSFVFPGAGTIKAGGNLIFDLPTSGIIRAAIKGSTNVGLSFYEAGVEQWSFGSAGGNFFIYDVSSSSQPFSIDGTTGMVTAAQSLTVNGNITQGSTGGTNTLNAPTIINPPGGGAYFQMNYNAGADGGGSFVLTNQGNSDFRMAVSYAGNPTQRAWLGTVSNARLDLVAYNAVRLQISNTLATWLLPVAWDSFANAKATRDNLYVVTKFKSSNTARTNNSVAADPDLQQAVASGELWSFDFICRVNIQDAAADFNCGIAFPSASASFYHIESWLNTTQLIGGSTPNATPTGGFVANVASPVDIFLRVQGFVLASASGAISLNWGQNVTSASATTMMAGSYAVFKRLN